MEMSGGRLGAVLFWVVLAPMVYGRPTRHEELHRRFEADAGLRLTAATYFGCEGVETFAGVVASGERYIVYGNAWGPSFPSSTPVATLGVDSRFDAPVYEAGTSRSALPRDLHPNRTGSNDGSWRG